MFHKHTHFHIDKGKRIEHEHIHHHNDDVTLYGEYEHQFSYENQYDSAVGHTNHHDPHGHE